MPRVKREAEPVIKYKLYNWLLLCYSVYISLNIYLHTMVTSSSSSSHQDNILIFQNFVFLIFKYDLHQGEYPYPPPNLSLILTLKFLSFLKTRPVYRRVIVFLFYFSLNIYQSIVLNYWAKYLYTAIIKPYFYEQCIAATNRLSFQKNMQWKYTRRKH